MRLPKNLTDDEQNQIIKSLEDFDRSISMKKHASKCLMAHINEDHTGPDCTTCDGYHTFNELYDHRITLFIALCRFVIAEDEAARSYGGVKRENRVWRSKLHYDDTSFEGWFIMGIGKEKDVQISYHIPLSRWEETNFAETLERAPEWDGHTSDDVLNRLKTL